MSETHILAHCQEKTDYILLIVMTYW